MRLPADTELSSTPVFRLGDVPVNLIYMAEASCRNCSADLAELKRLEERHPELVTPTSPTQRVGGEPLDGPRHLWWNFVHSDKERIEQAKADGTYEYVQHRRMEGMLHGRVVRPRGQRAYGAGAPVVAIDESSIAHIPGARALRKGDFIGVVAPRGERPQHVRSPAHGRQLARTEIRNANAVVAQQPVQVQEP